MAEWGWERCSVLKELREKMGTERLVGYFRDTRGWGDEADRWLGEEVLAAVGDCCQSRGS